MCCGQGDRLQRLVQLLRPGVLDGVALLLAHTGAPSAIGTAVGGRAAALGAHVGTLALDPDGDEPAPPEEPVDVLVWDGAAAFGDGASVASVRAALDGAWLAIRPLAQRPVQVQLLAPPPGGAHAAAARAGLENLARTLSIEWARFGARLVAILPGPAASADEVAELAAYLASPAGAYFSGCQFELG